MFVIVTSYYNVVTRGEAATLGDKIGQTMRHAGVRWGPTRDT